VAVPFYEYMRCPADPMGLRRYNRPDPTKSALREPHYEAALRSRTTRIALQRRTTRVALRGSHYEKPHYEKPHYELHPTRAALQV